MLCGNLSRSSPRTTGLTEVKRAFQIYPYSITVDKNVENVSAAIEVAEVTRIQKIESWGRARYQEGKHGKGIHSHDATRGLNIRSMGWICYEWFLSKMYVRLKWKPFPCRGFISSGDAVAGTSSWSLFRTSLKLPAWKSQRRPWPFARY